MNKCKLCNNDCKPSKALLNTLVETTDLGTYGERGNTQSRVGDAELVDCMKCENCGHSFIPFMTNEEKLRELMTIATANGYNDQLFINIVNNGIIEGLGIYFPFKSRHSLDELILDYENDEISFIEALIKADYLSIINWSKTMDIGLVNMAKNGGFFDNFIHSIFKVLTVEVIQAWSYDDENMDIRPSSERLEWLFKTFKHLL